MAKRTKQESSAKEQQKPAEKASIKAITEKVLQVDVDVQIKDFSEEERKELLSNINPRFEKRKDGRLAGNGKIWAKIDFNYAGKNITMSVPALSSIKLQNKKTQDSFFIELYANTVQELKKAGSAKKQ